MSTDFLIKENSKSGTDGKGRGLADDEGGEACGA